MLKLIIDFISIPGFKNRTWCHFDSAENAHKPIRIQFLVWSKTCPKMDKLFLKFFSKVKEDICKCLILKTKTQLILLLGQLQNMLLFFFFFYYINWYFGGGWISSILFGQLVAQNKIIWIRYIFLSRYFKNASRARWFSNPKFE